MPFSVCSRACIIRCCIDGAESMTLNFSSASCTCAHFSACLSMQLLCLPHLTNGTCKLCVELLFVFAWPTFRPMFLNETLCEVKNHLLRCFFGEVAKDCGIVRVCQAWVVKTVSTTIANISGFGLKMYPRILKLVRNGNLCGPFFCLDHHVLRFFHPHRCSSTTNKT